MRVLSVEDDLRISDFLTRGLKAEGYAVTSVTDGMEGLNTARAHEFDVIILDLMLPGVSGLDLCQTLRQEGDTTPILMLTAMDSLEDKIGGLRMGADDYMTKPFAFDELIARLEALARRSGSFTADTTILTVGDLNFNLDSLQVTSGSEGIELTAKEMTILELMMSSPGTVFSRERLLSNVWGLHADPLTNVVEVYIGKLRKKLQCGDNPVQIETIRGRGYRLVEPQ